MSTFCTSKEMAGASNESMRAALTTLTNNGFTIVQSDPEQAVLTGPGYNSTNQNPLRGASKILLDVKGEELRLVAELGGVDRMLYRLRQTPIWILLGGGLLVSIFALVFSLLGINIFRNWILTVTTVMSVLLPALPWLYLVPKLSKMVRSRTEQALANLVNNAAQIAKFS